MSDIVNQRPLSPEVIVASILLSPHIYNQKTMGEVARIIVDLDGKGVSTARMVCYLTAGSAYCEDLDRFVSKLVSFGYATDSSPIRLTTAGKEICQRIVDNARGNENPEQLRMLVDVLTAIEDAD